MVSTEDKLSVSDSHPKCSSSSTSYPELLDDSILSFTSSHSLISSDISGELLRLATLPNSPSSSSSSFNNHELSFSSDDQIIETISPQHLQSTITFCITNLSSSSILIQRSAAANLRFLAKNHADNRTLIADSGAVPALIPLLKCTDPWTQEHAVTAILNLSLNQHNKSLIVASPGAIKYLIYVLKSGTTDVSKQNAAAALMSLAMLDEETRLTIGAWGAIPHLVGLLKKGTSRGKKDALTTLYKLCCTTIENKERAVTGGAVAPLVELVKEQEMGVEEKAIAVLSCLAGVEVGREKIVEEGGISALVEIIENSCSRKGKEFAVITLLQLCGESVKNKILLVAEGIIPPLVALSQSGTPRARHKADTLLRYLRELRHQEVSFSSP